MLLAEIEAGSAPVRPATGGGDADPESFFRGGRLPHPSGDAFFLLADCISMDRGMATIRVKMGRKG